jgi:hypothetical protein
MYKYLNPEFLKAMDEIGEYGFKKHGENSFQAAVLRGDGITRVIDRHSKHEIMKHCRLHTFQYEVGELHDHFNDELHQLAAVGFNAMMEAIFAHLIHSKKETELSCLTPEVCKLIARFIQPGSADQMIVRFDRKTSDVIERIAGL